MMRHRPASCPGRLSRLITHITRYRHLTLGSFIPHIKQLTGGLLPAALESRLEVRETEKGLPCPARSPSGLGGTLPTSKLFVRKNQGNEKTNLAWAPGFPDAVSACSSNEPWAAHHLEGSAVPFDVILVLLLEAAAPAFSSLCLSMSHGSKPSWGRS